MAVIQCGGCERLISVSIIPGGNPVAKEDPQRWSSARWQCAACKVNLCDRCAPSASGACPSCRNTTCVAADRDPGTEDVERDETGDWAARSELAKGRLTLVVAFVAALLLVVAMTGRNKSVLFLITWLLSFFGGLDGVRRVAMGTSQPRVVAWLSAPLLFLPVVNLLPLGYFLYQGHMRLGQMDREMAAAQAQQEARRRARERARQRAAPPVAGPEAPSSADLKAAPASTAPAALQERLSRAVATVKIVGLGGVAEGKLLDVRISDPAFKGTELGDQAPVVRASKGFGVFYAVDEGRHFAYVTQGELRASDMTAEQLHQTGLRNLAALVKGDQPGLSLHGDGPARGLAMGGHFEASLVLLDALWDGPLKPRIPNGAVVAIPARDVCAFCDADSAEGIAQLRLLVQSVTQDGDHLLSDTLFVRRNGSWTALA